MTAFGNEENQNTTMLTGQVIGLTQSHRVSSAISHTQLNGEFLFSFIYCLLSLESLNLAICFH